jgi:hypothetical protein
VIGPEALKNFQPSLGNALHAIRLTSQHLRAAVWTGQDLPGREGMMHQRGTASSYRGSFGSNFLPNGCGGLPVVLPSGSAGAVRPLMRRARK